MASTTADEKSLKKKLREYCEDNYELYAKSVNSDFDKAIIRGVVGPLFVLGSTLVALACYLNMGQTWLLFSHAPSSLFLLSAWLIFPFMAPSKRPAVLWFDITLLIMLIEIYFIIGAYLQYAPKSLSAISTLGFDLFIFLAISAHPNRQYRILRDGFFVVGNFLVMMLHDSSFLKSGEEIIAFLRFPAIYGMTGIAIATLINFIWRFRFYFDFISKSAKIHAYQQMAKLLYQHQIAGIEAGMTLEETMPVGKGKAAVINFDVQNSGALGHDHSHEFFESINKKSYELMIQNYQGEARMSDAFLIKEMGDGFLCSIGFPFTSPGLVHEQAVRMSDQFIKLFEVEVAKFFPEQKVFCSVGIAYGEVTGKFPSIGVRSYDVFGDTIVKATRYEGMRKILFQNFDVDPGHIMILQSEVYQNLPNVLKPRFQRIELNQFRVRDDPTATHLYFEVKKAWRDIQAGA